MKNILFIIGSLRKGSFNRQMAKTVEELMGDRANVSYLDFSNLPYMNQDAEFPTPKEVEHARQAVSDADGLWFFTPEYNSSYPGLLKNLLDWLSRPLKENDFSSGTAIAGKKATISGVGGKMATAGSRAKLTELLDFIKVDVVVESTGHIIDADAWTTGNLTLSAESKETLSKQADDFLASI